MTRDELRPFYRKKIRLRCTDGFEAIGTYCHMDDAIDNESGKDELVLDQGANCKLDIPVDEIASVELIEPEDKSKKLNFRFKNTQSED